MESSQIRRNLSNMRRLAMKSAKTRRIAFYKLLAMTLAISILLSGIAIAAYTGGDEETPANSDMEDEGWAAPGDAGGESEPGGNEPGESEPGGNEPGENEPAKSEADTTPELKVIAEFAALPEEALFQSYAAGAVMLEDLNLPSVLAAFDADGSPIVLTDVTWTSIPEFDPEVSVEYPGYLFNPVLPEGYELAENANPPVIAVFISPADDSEDDESIMPPQEPGANSVNDATLAMDAADEAIIMPLLAPGSYNINDSSLVIDTDGEYTITGTGASTPNTITVNNGVKADIKLENVNISTGTACAFEMKDATVNLTLAGTNTLISASSKAGLHVPVGAELTIGGEGTLSATGGSGGAGIGGNRSEIVGRITINSGTVTASGCAGIGSGCGTHTTEDSIIIITGGNVTATVPSGHSGAGIGAGYAGNNKGTINISGGTLKATGNGGGAGIGGGSGGSGGNITFSGGDITATGSSGGAGIGGGSGGSGGDITISGGTVTARGGVGGGAGIGGGSGASSGNIDITGGNIAVFAGSSAAMAIGRGSGSGSYGNANVENYFPYYWWANTSISDPGGNGTYNRTDAFENSETYKYVRIGWEPDLGFLGPVPDNMTLTQGYKAENVRYHVYGEPRPTVRLISATDSDSIDCSNHFKLDDSSRIMTIEPGLTEGVYTIKLEASNDGYLTEIEKDFTLTVVRPIDWANITGPASMTILDRYTASTLSKHTVSGASGPFIITNSSVVTTDKDYDGKIKWNNTAKYLDIKDGLAVGDYDVVLTAKASDAKSPDATLNFRLTVISNPSINGKEGGKDIIELIEGYSAFTKQYDIHGTPKPEVSCSSVDIPGVSVDVNGLLQIPAGLTVADSPYTVIITATNKYATGEGEVTKSATITVEVNVLPPTEAPSINGQTSGSETINLTENYTPAYTKQYNITGKPKPSESVTGTAGAYIENGLLTVPTGLTAAGSPYTVIITATNNYANVRTPAKSATMTITINVSPETKAPRINGQASGSETINLTENYASAYTKQYIITGNPTPGESVTGTAGAYIKNGLLTVPTGLTAAGSPYTALIEAANTEGTVTMAVTVEVSAAQSERNSVSGNYGDSDYIPPASPGHFDITGYMTKAKIQGAIQAAQENDSALVKTRLSYPEGHILIKPELLALMKSYEYIHDTTGSPVQVRVRIPRPDKVKSTVYLCGSVTGKEVNSIKALFAKWFVNDIRVVDLHQKEPWGQTVKLAARVDFSGMNTENLYFYSYNNAANKYAKIKTRYIMDEKGYIHFDTPLAGSIIISDGALSKETQAVPALADTPNIPQNPTTGGGDVPPEYYHPYTGVFGLELDLAERAVQPLAIIWISAAAFIFILFLWAFIPRKNDEYINKNG